MLLAFAKRPSPDGPSRRPALKANATLNECQFRGIDEQVGLFNQTLDVATMLPRREPSPEDSNGLPRNVKSSEVDESARLIARSLTPSPT
jgi:hypothetical protein